MDNLAEAIARIEGLLEKATDRTWIKGGPYPATSIIICTDGGCYNPECPEPPQYEPICILTERTEGEPDPQAETDADLIVELRNHAPALLAAAKDAESLRALLGIDEELQRAIDAMKRRHYGEVGDRPVEISHDRAPILEFFDRIAAATEGE